MCKRKGKTGGTVQSLIFLSMAWFIGLGLAAPDPFKKPKDIAPPRYAVIDLGPSFLPVALNNKGTVISANAIWKLGTNTMLAAGPLSGGIATALNDDDKVVGTTLYNYPYPGFNDNHPGFDTPSLDEWHACRWDTPFTTNTPVDLDGQHTNHYAHNGAYFTVGGQSVYQSTATAIDSAGLAYGTTTCDAWQTAASFTTTGDPVAAMPGTNSLTLSRPSGPESWVTGTGGTNYCGLMFSGGVSLTNYGMINGQAFAPDAGYTRLAFNSINTNAVATGVQYDSSTTNRYAVIHWGGTNMILPGQGYGQYINKTTTTPQVIGTNTSGVVLWDKTQYNGLASTNTDHGGYVQKNLSRMLFQPDGTNIALTAVAGINDNGLIAATATYTQVDTEGHPTAHPETHGVLLLPCQFKLLNGSQTAGDSDGADFDGNRFTLISSTQPDNPIATAGIGTNGPNGLGNSGIDVLGPDNPIGSGRGTSHNVDSISLIVEAKVPPSSANIQYAWERTYNMRSVIIKSPISPSPWYVRSVNSNLGYETGYPGVVEDSDNPARPLNSIVPSSKSILYAYDNPGMVLEVFEASLSPYNPSINDYAYQRRLFTYYLTNSVGSAQAVAIFKIECFNLAQMTNSTPGNTAPWKRIFTYATSTNTPSCKSMTTNEIQKIVNTSAIQFDSNVNQDDPNP